MEKRFSAYVSHHIVRQTNNKVGRQNEIVKYACAYVAYYSRLLKVSQLN